MAARRDRFQRASARGRDFEETTMPNDTDFTLSLFDNTAWSSLNTHTLQAVTQPDETSPDDADDADQDGETPPPSADPVARGTNFHLAGDRALARGWAARARDKESKGADRTTLSWSA